MVVLVELAGAKNTYVSSCCACVRRDRYGDLQGITRSNITKEDLKKLGMNMKVKLLPNNNGRSLCHLRGVPVEE